MYGSDPIGYRYITEASAQRGMPPSGSYTYLSTMMDRQPTQLSAAYAVQSSQGPFGSRRLQQPFERAVNALIVGTSMAAFGTVITFLSYFILSCYGVC